MTRTIWAAAAAVAMLGSGLGSGSAIAFQAPTDIPSIGKKAPDGTTAEERSSTARLNAEQAARARQDNVTYEQEVSAVEQQVAHDKAEFAKETAAYEAEKARVAAMSAEERMKWEAGAAACKAGDLTHCAKPVPPQP